MLVAGITSNDVIAIIASATFCGGVGAFVSRRIGATKRHRDAEKRARAAESEARAIVDDALQQLTWAVGGKPADEYNAERTPGLIEQMKKLRGEFRVFVNENATVMKVLVERLEETEETRETKATAAAAILETATQAEQVRLIETAQAAAKVLEVAAAALAEQLRKAQAA